MKKFLLASIMFSGAVFAHEDASLTLTEKVFVKMLLEEIQEEKEEKEEKDIRICPHQAAIHREPLLALLAEIQPIIAGVNPTEADVAFVMNLIAPDLELIEKSPEDDLQQALAAGFSKLKGYFYSDELTLGQKAALYWLMHAFATKL